MGKLLKPSVRIALCWLLLTSCMLGVVGFKFISNSITFDANIMNVLDLGEEIDDLTKAAAAPYATKALLLVQHTNDETSRTVISQLKQQLLTRDWILSAATDPSASFDMLALTKTYSQYPLALLSANGIAARQADNYDYVINQYMQLLSGPSNPLVSLTINQAPLLNLADWFNDKLTQNNWHQDAEFIYVEHNDLRYYPLFLDFSQSATAMDKVVNRVQQLNQLLAKHQSPDMTIYSSGFIFHSAAITAQASFEMQLFGGLSLLGVLLLTLISFRTIQPLLCISLLIGSASLAGMFALTLVFNTVHLLSLVFAVSLIGIAVDYGYHILLTAKHTGLRDDKLSKHIALAILVSGGTTLVSYLLLLFLPIPLLQQVAVFVAAGLIFTVFTGLTVISYWPWQSKANAPTNNRRFPSLKLDKPIKGFKVLSTLLIVTSLAALPNWYFQDDINVFNSSPQHLLDNEKQVNQIIGNQQYPRFIYTQAADTQQLLERLELIRQSVKKVDQGKFELRGIDQWLPSIRTQKQNSQWLLKGLQTQKLSAISSYIPEQTLAELGKQSNQYVTLEQLPDQITQLFPSISHKNNKTIGILSYMGPIDQAFMQAIEQQLDFAVFYFDQPAKYTSALTKLRTYVLYFLGAAVLSLLLLMTIRYGLTKGLSLAYIPIITAFSALALSHFILGYVTIFNLLGCILIVALSVDYAVFLREHGRLAHVLKAVTLSAATSGIAFGMFIFSSTPAILQFGLTILLGVGIAWILCLMMPLSILNKTRPGE